MIRNSVILFVLFFAVGCMTDNNSDKPVITVSILPQRFLIQKIAGSNLDINVMVPPGASPAAYDPSPVQLQQLSRSEAYFMIGNLVFENIWIEKITSVNKSMQVFDLSSGIELIREDHHHKNEDRKRINTDPHIWLSPKALKIMCHNIYMALKEINPADSLVYKQNCNNLLVELDSVDRKIMKSLSGLDSRKFFIYHPALTYFARDYKLQQVSVEQEGKPPSTFYLKHLVNLAEKENIRIIFIQEQFDIENAQVLAKEIDGKVVKIDPLDEDLLSQLIYITSQLQMNLDITDN